MKTVVAELSNECDNMYQIVFPVEAFQSLLNEELNVSKIRGTVKYESADEIKSQVRITCRKLY